MKEVTLELAGVVGNVFSGVFADKKHLPDVRFGLGVTLEAIFVAGLFLASLNTRELIS